MLKHLKMKAAMLQDDLSELYDGDAEGSEDTDVVEQSDKGENLLDQITQEHFIHSTTVSYTKKPEAAIDEAESKDVAVSHDNIPTSTASSICYAQINNSHDTSQFVHEDTSSMKFTPPHGSNIHAVYNTYRSVCQDPNCHCSPTKVLTRHSPNMEGNCSCFSCLHRASLPTIVHHTSSVPYLPPNHVVESSPHLHPPGSGVFYSPQHSYQPQKHFFQSPYGSSGLDWSKLASPSYNGQNINHVFHNSFHSYPPQKLPLPFWSPPNQQECRLGGSQTLTLPLTRPTIVSLLKRGKCDVILRVLDGPLHDESSPLYPVALHTVLEILDVVEKEFANAYRGDKKIRTDIHHLTTFVKGMTNATDSPNIEESMSKTGTKVTSKSTLTEKMPEDNPSTTRTHLPRAVEEDTKKLVSEIVVVNNSAVAPSESARGDAGKPTETKEANESNKSTSEGITEKAAVTPPVPQETQEIIRNASDGTTVKRADGGFVEHSKSYGTSTREKIGLNESCESTGISLDACDAKNTEVEKSCESASHIGNAGGNDLSPENSSITLKNFQENISAEGSKSSDATENNEPRVRNLSGLQDGKAHVEHIETVENEVSCSKEYEPPMPVLERELPLQELSVGGESKSENNDRSLDSDVDSLLDQTLKEADQAKSKEMHQNASSTKLEEPTTSGSSDYRGKGYKVRAVNNSDKQVTKVKAPVKTFAQIREKNVPLVNGSKILPVDHKPKHEPKVMGGADSVTKVAKDLNGNIVHLSEKSTEVKMSEGPNSVNTDSVPRESTPELVRCPSNPLSPSCSDSLDSTDFKSFLDKSKGRTPIGSVSNENVDSIREENKSSNSALALLDQMRNLPLPKEPVKQGGSGKPLISKSFHGKLLLQKHSKDDPYPIPLEITDSDFIPRDPRLSLSNLMESKVNYELSLLKWEDNQNASQKLPKTTEFPLNQAAINVRDPRIRRRLSEDVSVPGLNGSVQSSLVGIDVISPDLPELKKPNFPEVGKSIGQKIDDSTVKGIKITAAEAKDSPVASKSVTPESIVTKSDIASTLNGEAILRKPMQNVVSKLEVSSVKGTQNCPKGNATVSEVGTPLAIKASSKSDSDQVGQNTTVDNFEHEQRILKSTIHSIRKTGDVAQLKKKEIPEIASTVSSCNISEIDKMDTIVSFREALDVIKEIKSELKKDLEKCGSKIENIGKDKAAKLGSKVKLLRQTCEVGLLSTEVQRKKASGQRYRDLCGLLEDHFILIADLTVLGVWLKTGNSDINDCRQGLPEFKKGVFTRRAVPCFKKLEKWLRNRYKLDGFENDKLLKLVSMIGKSGDGKRSRSRSSSTGSGKHKRRKVKTTPHDDGKEKRKHSKKSDHPNEPSDSQKRSGSESPVVEQRKRARSPNRKVGSPNSKRLKDGKSAQGKEKSETPNAATKSDSDTSSEVVEQSPPPKSGSTTPRSETEKATEEEAGKNSSKQNVADNGDSNSQEQTKPDGSSSQRKQSVSVNSGIQDIQEDMEQIKKSVLNVFRKRSTTSANRCMEELTEISHKAHTQLDDENKTYTSLKNVSIETKAKFHDVIKGIQRLIVDCEILVYTLSSAASKVTARETKDKIWQNAQKSSHKPSYEEELALLLSLRKTYLHSDLWRYIKTDVDERISSLQKKCRARDSGSQRSGSSSIDYNSVERPSSWVNSSAVPSQSAIPRPVGDYERRPEVAFHSPGTSFNIDYHGSYLSSSDRSNFPSDVFSTPSNRPFVRDGYHSNGSVVPLEPYQPMSSFLPRNDHIKFEWTRKYDDDFDAWGVVRRNPLTSDVDYGGRYYTPPPAI